jgi:nucleotide sugar dehydrogenase
MNIAVVGIGRVGLPVAAALAGRGHMVLGCDIDERRVAAVNRGENPIPDEAGLAALLAEVVAAGRLAATTDTATAVSRSEAILFAVAVDVDPAGRSDLSSLLAACASVSRGLQPGTLCVFDTTLPVGTTRTVLAPALERSGLQVGRDIDVAFSPERLLMGRVIEDLVKYPKVVGGLTPEAGERAAAFFRQALGSEVLLLPSAEAAELSKLAEGAYRDLNIALANELAQVADAYGVDIADVIRAANSQPYSHLHIPGTGVGGHCIPVYPRFLMQGDGPSALAALGRAVNDTMPGYAVRRLQAVAGPLEGRRVLVMGLTFRPDVAVTAHTNALDLLRELRAAGAAVEGHDPLLSREGVASLGFSPAPEPPGRYDAVIVHAFHRAYADCDWAALAPVVLDARNALDRRVIEDAGVIYIGIGRPPTPSRG